MRSLLQEAIYKILFLVVLDLAMDSKGSRKSCLVCCCEAVGYVYNDDYMDLANDLYYKLLLCARNLALPIILLHTYYALKIKICNKKGVHHI